MVIGSVSADYHRNGIWHKDTRTTWNAEFYNYRVEVDFLKIGEYK